MRRILCVAVVTAAFASGAFAATASAHNVYVKAPDSDFVGSTFTFKGTAWQPYQTVRWFYDQFADGSFNQSGSFAAGKTGNFNFRWTSNNTPGVHRVCFQQYDSRRGYKRYFTACDRYETFLDR